MRTTAKFVKLLTSSQKEDLSALLNMTRSYLMAKLEHNPEQFTVKQAFTICDFSTSTEVTLTIGDFEP